MARPLRDLVLALLVLLAFGSRALGSTQATITVGGTGAPISGAGSITVAFSDSAGNPYTETIQYGQYSTPASLASGLAAMFTRDYKCSKGLGAQATGVTITFQLNGASTFGPISIINPASIFSVATSSWVITPMLNVSTSAYLASYGSPVTFTAAISLGPSGAVTFYDGSVAIGTGTIDPATSTATYTTSALTAGVHSISASWSAVANGSTTFASVQSLALIQVVDDIALPGPGMITTIAGTGNSGVNGENIPATESSVYLPTSVALDSSLNVYLIAGERILKVSSASGLINTVAGTGTSDIFDNNRPSNSPPLTTPIGPGGLAVNSSGDIYFTDHVGQSGNTYVEVLPASSGFLTTIAGEYQGDALDNNIPALNAYLDGAQGVAVDGAGGVYIADRLAFVARYVSPSNGNISFAAGSVHSSGYNGDNIPATSAQLTDPIDVAVDNGGNFYIADWSGNRIRKVSSSGLISTIAGNGTAGYNGDNIKATEAELNHPIGVAVDSSGNVFIAEYSGQRVREVSASTGYISTIAGNGTPDFNGDNIPATSATLAGPWKVALDSVGNIYIADSGNSRIRVVGAAAPNVPPISVTCSPSAVVYGGANAVCTVLVGTDATGTVSLTYNGTSWATLPLSSGSASATWASTFGTGQYTITAAYSGDSTHAPGTASTVLTVNEVTPSIALSSSVNPIVSGELSTFTAAIGNGIYPTGVVTFEVNGTPFGTASVVNGVAVYNAGNESWSPGTYTISAVYGGDVRNAAATGTIFETVIVPPAGPQLALSSPSGAPGSTVTITGTGFGANQGTVTFNQTVQATVTRWSNTSIVITVPASLSGGLYPVAVNINGAATTVGTYLVTPQIVSLSPSTGPPSVGVIITGTGFGTTQGTVVIGTGAAAVQAPIVPGTWGVVAPNSQSTITIQIPPGTALGATPITVNVSYGPTGSSIVTSNPATFNVVDPLACN